METFIKVYIKSEEDLPEKEGNYISCTNDTNYIRDRHYRFSLRWNWLNGIIWYLKPVEIPEISDNSFSGQPTPDLCCGVYEEPPLELKICTRCNKEFKSNVDCPVCPSCYL